MKKLLLLAALVVFAIPSLAQKTGHINLNELLVAMPEAKQVETDIQKYAQELEGQLKAMGNEYESKITAYQAGEAKMSEALKMDKQKEIADLEERIQTFKGNAQESLQKKQNDLLNPVIEKCKKAIADVAKESGYRTVIDSGQGILLYTDEADNLMGAVKKKLNITDAPGGGVTAPKIK